METAGLTIPVDHLGGAEHLHNQFNIFNQVMTGLRYIATRKGPGASNGLESGSFMRTRPELSIPDIQTHFVAAVLYDHGRGKSPGHGFTVHMCQLRPESRGEVRLSSNDHRAAPIIQPNYLESEVDRKCVRNGIRMVREVLTQKAMSPYRGIELDPGPDVQTDDDIDAWVRQNAETIYHPVGTAKMGLPSDKTSVVDNLCRVHGFQGLRVVDASVMPTLVGGNTNAPTIMIAEKISDNILGKPALAAASIQYRETETVTLHSDE